MALSRLCKLIDEEVCGKASFDTKGEAWTKVTGKRVAYNTDNVMIDNAAMFGFIKNQNGSVAVANRLFETRLYNFYLSAAEQGHLYGIPAG